MRRKTLAAGAALVLAVAAPPPAAASSLRDLLLAGVDPFRRGAELDPELVALARDTAGATDLIRRADTAHKSHDLTGAFRAYGALRKLAAKAGGATRPLLDLAERQLIALSHARDRPAATQAMAAAYLKRVEARRPADTGELTRALRLMARATMAAGEDGHGNTYAERAFRTADRWLRRTDPEHGRSALVVAVLRLDQGALEQAEALALPFYDRLRDRLGADSIDLAALAPIRAQLAAAIRRFDEAAERLRAADATIRRLRGPGDPLRIPGLELEARHAMTTGRFTVALARREAVREVAGARGPDGPRAIRAQLDMAATRVAAGDLAGADAEVADATAALDRARADGAGGDLASLRGAAALRRAELMALRGEFGPARGVIEAALADLKTRLAPDDELMVRAWSRYGEVLTGLGRWEKGRSLARRAMTDYGKRRPPRDVGRIGYAARHVTVEADAGDFPRAEETLDAARRLLGKGTPPGARAELAVAAARLAWRKGDEAGLKAALARFAKARAALPEARPDLEATGDLLVAEAALMAGDQGSARAAHAAVKKAVAPWPQTAPIYDALRAFEVRVALARGDHGRAASLLKGWMTRLHEAVPGSHPFLAEALELTLATQEAAGQPAAAGDTAAKLYALTKKLYPRASAWRERARDRMRRLKKS